MLSVVFGLAKQTVSCTMWTIFFLVSLGVRQFVLGVTVDERLEACCRFGKSSNGKCESAKPVPGVPPEQQSICLSAAHLCCAHQLREMECYDGKAAAKTGGNCPDKKTTDEQNCCESCKLGLISGSMGNPCTLGNVSFGQLWDAAFQSCCEDTKKTQFPLTTKVPALVENVCQLLPGELCAHICVPTAGSYRCQCHEGFTLMADGKSCEQGEAQEEVKQRCSQWNPCAHKCEDTADGITCSCNPGFTLNHDNITCQIKNESSAPYVKCPAGFEFKPLAKVCRDINECEINTHTCNSEREVCVNTLGGFRCATKTPPKVKKTCQTGYKYNEADRNCIDINECTEVEDYPCDSNQICENSIGSYRCLCRTGFQLDSITHACVDINECQVSLHDCLPSQRCDNTIGSYQCIRYTNCGTGYTLNYETGQCEDDDECLLETDNCRYLGDDYQCRNTQGSFRCERRAQNDKIDPPPNTSICPGAAHCKHQIKCPKGYRQYGSRCIDINECEQGTMCRPNQRCVNSPGSYICTNILRCQTGFKPNEGKTQCVDIDECEEQRGNLCSHNCINLWGSFMCTCRNGFTINEDNRTCSDVNECELYKDRRLCMGYCVNQMGSYSCQCPQGYKLSLDGASCEDIDECVVDRNICKEEDEMCLNMRGSSRCIPMVCPPGYVKDSAHKNRCKREALSCLEGDSVCQQQPLTYSFHYITLVSNLRMPNAGKIDLFSMRGPLWASTTVDFSLDLIRARAPPGVNAATRSHFALSRSAHNQAGIALVQTLEGPQDIQLKLTMEFYNNGLFGGKTISNIDIYVSQFPF